MTPEEAQVYQSLARLYCFDPEIVGLCEVTPTSVLYETYLKHVHEIDGDPGTILNPAQFGIALHRTFGLESRSRRVQFRFEGKRHWGYRHVRGPQSIRVREQRGNPNFRKA